MNVDDARARIRALRHGATNTAKELDTLYRLGRKVTKHAKIYQSRTVDDDERYVRAGDGNGATSSACADCSWPAVLIFREFVLSRATTQQIPGVGRGGMGDFVGADKADLGVIAGRAPGGGARANQHETKNEAYVPGPAHGILNDGPNGKVGRYTGICHSILRRSTGICRPMRGLAVRANGASYPVSQRVEGVALMGLGE